jgi:hypothetical protein
VGLAVLVLLAGAATAQPYIPLWSQALENRFHLPDGLAFTARYVRGNEMLAFVGGRHHRQESLDEIKGAFRASAPRVVIVEAFPTVFGENPELIVRSEKLRDIEPDTTRGEPFYAAWLALRSNVPFIGGEPSISEEFEALEKAGYSRQETHFAFLVRDLVNAGVNASNLAETYAKASQRTAQRFNQTPMPLDEFLARYREAFGVAFQDDPQRADRDVPGPDTSVGRILQGDMHARDEHLLALIQEQLARRKRVLVVYGSSHWVTLSGALAAQLGEPKLKTYRKL